MANPTIGLGWLNNLTLASTHTVWYLGSFWGFWSWLTIQMANQRWPPTAVPPWSVCWIPGSEFLCSAHCRQYQICTRVIRTHQKSSLNYEPPIDVSKCESCSEFLHINSYALSQHCFTTFFIFKCEETETILMKEINYNKRETQKVSYARWAAQSCCLFLHPFLSWSNNQRFSYWAA